MKNEKHDSAKPVQIAIPSKDAIAIEPPKKVRCRFATAFIALLLYRRKLTECVLRCR